MSDLSTRPVPSWVLSAYNEVLVPAGAESVLRDTFERILAADGISSVWKSMERRGDSPDDPDGQWDLAALRLVEVCHEGIEGFAGSQRISHGTRAVVAAKVSEACNAIVELLDMMGLTGEGNLPEEFWHLSCAARDVCADDQYEGGATEQEKKRYREGVGRGAEIAVNKLGEILGALSSDAKNWAEVKSLVARPNKKNAARTYFIRHLTGYFIDEYGSPLRQQTLILAGAFFDVSDLDVSLISKLAPHRH